MARLNDKQRDDIVNAYHIGKSIYQIAKDFEVSTATVHKLVKDLTPKLKDEVKAQIAIKSKLIQESENLVKAFNDEVKEQLHYKLLVNNNASKALNKLNTMLDEVDNAMDLKTLIDANDRASITLKVNERFAPKSDVNLVNAQQNNENTQIVFKRIGSNE